MAIAGSLCLLFFLLLLSGEQVWVPLALLLGLGDPVLQRALGSMGRDPGIQTGQESEELQ